MAHPRISIIIPLFNKAPYVKKALESVKAQTFTDYECIIVNDGSTDNSLEVVSDYCLMLNDVRFRVINQKNAGVSAARNRGIAESKGDYLAFLDADDWWEPSFIDEMMGLINDYPEAGIYASNYIYWKPGKTRVGVKANVIADCRLQIADCTTAYINYPKAYYENGEQVVWTGAAILKKSIVDCLMLNDKWFNEDVLLGEDFLLWARIAMRYKVAFLNKPLAYYNNDIPAGLRLTQNLHRPEAHMLWHLDECLMLNDECLMLNDECLMLNDECLMLSDDWKKLFDRLRVLGLYKYWLSKEYHDVAKEELKKVDWTILDKWKESQKYKKLYQLPVWLLRWRQDILVVGSYWKQQVVKLLNA